MVASFCSATCFYELTFLKSRINSSNKDNNNDGNYINNNNSNKGHIVLGEISASK